MNNSGFFSAITTTPPLLVQNTVATSTTAVAGATALWSCAGITSARPLPAHKAHAVRSPYVGLLAAALTTACLPAFGQATADPTSNTYPLAASRTLTAGVAGTAADGVTDDSAALASACVAGADIRLKAASYYIGNSVSLACSVHIPTGATFNIASGKVLTFSGKIDAPPVTIFTGAGTESLGPMNTEVPVEWFGAVGDFNVTTKTGTDNTAAIQEAINSLYAGHIDLQARGYAISSALQFTRDNIGILGASEGYIYPTSSPTSILWETSASSDIIDLAGTSSNYVVWNDFKRFAIQRTVVPTGNAAGFSVNFAGGPTVQQVYSQDSVRDFYLHAVPSYGIGSFANDSAGWGYSIVSTGSYTSGSHLYGWYLDSADGNAENTLILNEDAVAIAAGAPLYSYGFYMAGQAVNDVDMELPNTAGTSYGLYLTQSGSANSGSSGDILVHKGTFDNWAISGVYVSGLVNSQLANIVLSDLYSVSRNSGTTAAVQVVNSSGVDVTNGELVSHGGNGVLLTGATNTKLIGNRIYDATTGINADSASTGLIAEGTFFNSDVTTHFSGSALDVSTQNFGNNSFEAMQSAGTPAYWGIVNSNQAIFSTNAYNNGSAWIAPTAGTAGAMRAGTTSTYDYPGMVAGLTLHTCKPQTAGGTIADMDTNCVGFLQVPGINLAGGQIQHIQLNGLNDSPVHPGVNFGTDTVLQVNLPNKADNYASAIFAPTAVADKAAVIQALPGQTGNIFAAEDSSGSPHLTIDSGANLNGPATAPTGSCAVAGSWVFSQDGHATFCPSAGGTWTMKI